MKRIRAASRQSHLTKFYASHLEPITERQRQHLRQKKAEQQWVEQVCSPAGVAQSANRFFALSSDILGIVKFDGYFNCLSSACERILGFSQADFSAIPFLEFVHPDDRAATVAIVQRLMTGERVDRFENRYRCKDGSYKWLSWSGIAAVEEELIYCTARDITEQKQSEETLRQSNQYYESLIHSLNGIVWEVDLQTGQFVFVSQKAEDILGYPVEQWLTEAYFWENHIHPEDREETILGCQQFVLQKQDGQLEYRMIAASGRTIWIQDIVTLVMEREQPIKLRGVLIDITERKRLEAALQESEARYRMLASHFPNGVVLLFDQDLRYVLADGIGLEELGLSKAEVEGKTIWEVLPPQTCELVEPFYRSALQGNASVAEMHCSNQVYLAHYLPIQNEDERLAAGMVMTQNITEQKRAEAALLYQREQEQLVVEIAQQIRQSLHLEEILHKTVTAVREFLKSDRVLIYHLEAEIGGRVIAESVGAPWKTISGVVINDGYFNETYAHLYQQGRVQAVEDIYTAGLTPCHLDLLAQFQVRANLAIPIVQEDELWGLLVVQQCDAPRQWQMLEVNLLKQLATQVAIAIQQSELYGQAQGEIIQRQQAEAALYQQAEREKLLGIIAQRIRQTLDPIDVLNTTVTEVRQLLKADRTIIFRFDPDWSGVVTVESVNSPWKAILGENIYDPCFTKTYIQPYQQGRVRAIEDIFTAGLGKCHVGLLTRFQVRANLVVPILQGDHLWGLLIAHQCSGPRMWHPDEVNLLQQLSTQVAIAIQQSELYQQVQQLNANLEVQVQERTLELQQSLEFEALLKRITDKVRDSLDEAQILQTAVQELAIGLKVKCCDTALYDFEAQTSTICFEHITSDVPTAKGQTFAFSNLPEVYDQLFQGQYVQFSPISGLACWRTGIAPYTILICPLMDDQGVLGDMWLFRPHQDSFNTLEIRLVEQVANQCVIALRQSRLYQAAQAQVTELERLNRLKDDFLSTVSHELRTPMSSIKMAIQMLEVLQPQLYGLHAENDRSTRYFNILRSECQREINLINDLLDLTRLDAETEPLNLGTIALQIWIPHVLEPFEQRVQNQQQQLQVCIPETLPPITTDLSYLERILTELLNNACKYTPAGERILVSVEAISQEAGNPKQCNPAAQETTSSSLSIAVCNSGVEISNRELARVFDKFYRIPNNDPWKHGGTGLGLALVQRLVERINGKIEATSSDKQTTFTVQLPLEIKACI